MAGKFGILLITLLLLLGCGRSAGVEAALPDDAAVVPARQTVFAAASLTNAFTALGREFEAGHPGVRVTFNFAGSQQLAQQLAQGAPGDVFASANEQQMEAAVDSGRIAAGAVQTFVQNRLVIIFPADNPAGISRLQDLAKPGLKVLLAAAAVPVGQYSLDFLDKASQDPAFGSDFKERVLANVVSYEENVRSVLTKVALGEADAGIVYTSDVIGTGSENVVKLDIPDNLNAIASYPIARVTDSDRSHQAQAFVDFVLSAAGQQILADYGFIPVR